MRHPAVQTLTSFVGHHAKKTCVFVMKPVSSMTIKHKPAKVNTENQALKLLKKVLYKRWKAPAVFFALCLKG